MSTTIQLHTISDLTNLFMLKEKPKHPLITVVDFSQVRKQIDGETRILADFYCVLFKDYCSSNVRYGRELIDFKDGRQFITRKTSNSSVTSQVEKILSSYFRKQSGTEKTLPTVKYLAEQVNLSPGYLSDLLRKETGKNAQEQIHFYLIEEAKNILLSTEKTIGEIAYELGFEYPQYFNKLFKSKTGKTPVEFRQLN